MARMILCIVSSSHHGLCDFVVVVVLLNAKKIESKSQ